MTDNEQAIAIATACGWTECGKAPLSYGDGALAGFAPGTCLGYLPNYLSDLNAMHEAEKVLVDEQRFNFGAALCDTCCTNEMCIGECCHATAAQRAEAFLRTLNLWIA